MFRRSQILLNTLRRQQTGPQEYYTRMRGRGGGRHVVGGVLVGLGIGYFMWGSEQRARFWAERAHQHHWHRHCHNHVCPTCFYERHKNCPQALNNEPQTGGVAPPAASSPGYSGSTAISEEEKTLQ